MYYSNSRTHRIKYYLFTAFISVFLISCSDASITDLNNETGITPELMGTWNPINGENKVVQFERFSLQKNQGVYEFKNENYEPVLYRLFEWEVKVPGKFIEITLLRHIEDGVEEYVYGNKELIDISINDNQLTMYGKRWIKKNKD